MHSPTIEIIARGVLIHQDRVLLCQNRQHGHTFLPGGHVEFGEPAARALEREVREELGITLVATRFRGACEAAFEQPTKKGGSIRHHELNLIFQLEPPARTPFDPNSVKSQEDHIQFIWQPVNDLGKTNILPPGMAALIVAGHRSVAPSESTLGWLSAFD